jgi:PAS domain S-box-containing protein
MRKTPFTTGASTVDTTPDTITRVLVLEKVPSSAQGHVAALRAAGFDALALERAAQVLRLLRHPYVLVTDMPDTLELEGIFIPGSSWAPLTIVLGPDSTTEAVRAMRRGAFDYLPQPVDTERLCRAVAEALHHGDGREARPDTCQAELRLTEQLSREIDVRKRAEQALLNQSRFLEALLSSLPTPVFYKDMDGMYLGCNQAYCEFMGIPRHEILGKTVTECWPPELARIYEQRDKELLESGGVQNYEGPLILASGEQRDVIFKKAFFHLADGSRGGIIGLIVDTTRRKMLEEALREARQKADAANLAKSEFLATMSHEIRTPLAAVLGMADLLMRSPLTGEQKRHLRILTNAGEALLELISDILDLSRIEAGKLPLDVAPFSPADLIREISEVMSVPCRKKGLELRGRIHDSVPAMVLGDRARVRQIIVNLVGNAVKFTEKGHVRIDLRPSEEQGELQCSVSDTGVGIPLDKQLLIFDRFTQADTSTTRQFGGSGLGLAICRSLSEQMGGRIWLESTPGKGSTFHVTLPLQATTRVAPAANAPLEPEDAGAEPPVADIPLRLLLLEDSEYLQELFMQFVKATPHRLRVAGNGKDGLRLLRQESFDLVLMDLQMPIMDGFETLRRLRQWEAAEKRKPVRVIAVSADALTEKRNLCLRSGFDDFLAKPIRQEQFLRILERHAADKLNSGGQAGLRCLLADESEVMRLIISKVLREFGCDQILEAGNGLEALELARKHPLDCIICDWNMPHLRGADLLHELRRLPDHAATPCVLLTAGPADELDLDALRLDAVGSVAKPFRLEELKRELARIIPRLHVNA